MSKELVISTSRHETKVAVLEDDQLVEIYFQRSNEYSLAGSIHKGRVTRVLPGMQSAFVDIGLERDAFLYVSDFFEENEDIDPLSADEKKPRSRTETSRTEARPERVERSERPERAESRFEARVEARPEPKAEPEPALLEDESVVPIAPLQAAPAATAARPTGSEVEQGAGGDRRRRSRRRRSRGGGFPDSKYASAQDEPDEMVASQPDAVESVQLPPLMLPGESLAKYARASEPEEAPRTRSAGQSFSLGSQADSIADYTLPPNRRDQTFSPVELAMDNLTADEPAADELPSGEPVISISSVEELEDHPLITGVEPVKGTMKAEASAEAEPTAKGSLSEALDGPATDVEPIDEQVEAEAPLAEALGEAPPDADDIALDAEPADAEDAGEAASEEVDTEEPDIEVLDADATPISSEEPATGERSASVRDNSGQGRFQQRGPRRMRRRGRQNHSPSVGGERPSSERPSGERPEAPAPRAAVAIPAVAAAVEPEEDEHPRQALPSITELLKEGQEIIVQIAKEPLGQKGARITSHIALPGRYVVYMPTLDHMGVSRKIESDEERMRLRKILHTHRAGLPGGFIVRTAGTSRTEEEIAADMQFLFNLWLDIRQKAEKKRAPLLLHHDLNIVQRILRDQLNSNFKTITLDQEELYESVLRFAQRFQPTLIGKIKLYTRPTPIFDTFGISTELEKALRPKVWLKSGGYIVINQTEALVAVDVNTGKFVGKSNKLEDTIVKTNLDAVKEIVRQIRLRDLGGIIVVDFIDMDERKNRQKVMMALEEAMQTDRAPNKILQFNDFGLVAITRKRVKQSLERTLCSPCPHCEGSGFIKSVQTVIGEILQEAVKIAKAVEGKDVMLRVHPDVGKALKSTDNSYLEELEEILGRSVMVKSDPLVHHERFDLA